VPTHVIGGLQPAVVAALMLAGGGAVVQALDVAQLDFGATTHATDRSSAR
jgi:hypothetical protein